MAGTNERALAVAFQRSVYLDEFGHVPADRFDEAAAILCAVESDETFVAALRVVLPEQRPFEFEDTVALEEILGDRCRPAVIGRLCVRKDYRVARRSLPLHAYLMRLTYRFAKRHPISDLILYTYDNLMPYYRGLFFQSLDVRIEHPHWGSVALMGLNVSQFQERYQHSRNKLARIILSDAQATIDL